MNICSKLFLVLLTICLAGFPSDSRDFTYSWRKVLMDGQRTGCTVPSKEDPEKALGYMEGRVYVSPSGMVFRPGTAASKTAEIVIGAQPAMARVKEIIGYSPETMSAEYPESALSNLFIDKIMEAVEKLSGKKVDIGIGNFGGIRVDMPAGDILLDDLLSMFPFKNQIVYVSHKGSEIRQILEKMASSSFQVLGGVRIVAEKGRIISAEIGGKPIEDDKVYGMATISFLLNGGDNLFLEKNALAVEKFDVDIIDVMLDYVEQETSAGRPVTYEADGRIVILD